VLIHWFYQSVYSLELGRTSQYRIVSSVFQFLGNQVDDIKVTEPFVVRENLDRGWKLFFHQVLEFLRVKFVGDAVALLCIHSDNEKFIVS